MKLPPINVLIGVSLIILAAFYPILSFNDILRDATTQDDYEKIIAIKHFNDCPSFILLALACGIFFVGAVDYNNKSRSYLMGYAAILAYIPFYKYDKLSKLIDSVLISQIFRPEKSFVVIKFEMGAYLVWVASLIVFTAYFYPRKNSQFL
jgi:hypothetical protein